MVPIVNGLEEEFTGRVAVYRLDAEIPENAALQASYGVRGHPSLVVLDADNRVHERFFGTPPVAALQAALQALP